MTVPVNNALNKAFLDEHHIILSPITTASIRAMLQNAATIAYMQLLPITNPLSDQFLLEVSRRCVLRIISSEQSVEAQSDGSSSV
jgi:hypothetical protein